MVEIMHSTYKIVLLIYKLYIKSSYLKGTNDYMSIIPTPYGHETLGNRLKEVDIRCNDDLTQSEKGP